MAVAIYMYLDRPAQVGEPLDRSAQIGEPLDQSAQIEEPLDRSAQIGEPLDRSAQIEEPLDQSAQIRAAVKSKTRSESAKPYRRCAKPRCASDAPNKHPMTLIQRHLSTIPDGKND